MNEQGRSLTEMLGVLAIIGVLSITAIFGYSYAMNKYRANDTIKELSERAILAASQMVRGQSALQNEMDPTMRQGYPVETVIYADDPRFFDISLSNVPQDVCTQILKSEYKSPVKIEVDGKWYRGDASICSDPSQMTFIFDKDLDAATNPPHYCAQDSDCSGCDVCVDNMCASSCTGSDTCARDSETGSDVCCAPDKYAGGLCCPSTMNGLCCNSSGLCCPSYRPLVDKNGKCHTCEADYTVDVTGVLSNCSTCPNRVTIGNNCVLPCGQGIYKDKPLMDNYGKCYACDSQNAIIVYGRAEACKICPNRYLYGNYWCNPGKCGEGEFKDKKLAGADYICFSCDNEAAIYTYQANCAACPDRKYVGAVCIKPCKEGSFNAGLTSNDNTGKGCFSCDEPNPVSLYLGDKSLCSACPNRTVRVGSDWASWGGNQCVIDCGTGIYKDKPLLDMGARCFSCDNPGAVTVRNKTDCDICPNRHVEGNQCMLDCPSDRPLMDSYGNCYPCDSQNVVNVYGRTEACKICPNRIINNADGCILPCGQGVFANRPLLEYNGVCRACDGNTPIFVAQKEDCGACPNRQLIASTDGTNYFCANPCPADKPLQDANGTCHACDTDSTVNVRWNALWLDTCRVCPNREIVGNNCVKKG